MEHSSSQWPAWSCYHSLLLVNRERGRCGPSWICWRRLFPSVKIKSSLAWAKVSPEILSWARPLETQAFWPSFWITDFCSPTELSAWRLLYFTCIHQSLQLDGWERWPWRRWWAWDLVSEEAEDGLAKFTPRNCSFLSRMTWTRLSSSCGSITRG